MDRKPSGFEEIEHTADWALRVWATDLPALLSTAARGMYALMETTLSPGERASRSLSLEAVDAESLLVAFLSELLYDGETQGVGYDDIQITLSEVTAPAITLTAHLTGAGILSQNKEIKAVTFHNLNIQTREGSWTVTIVFDV